MTNADVLKALQDGKACIERLTAERDRWKTAYGEAYAEKERLRLQLGEERERCAKIVEEFDDWVWPDKKSEAYREAGDFAGPDTNDSLKRLAIEIRQQQPEKQICEHDWTASGVLTIECRKCKIEMPG